MKPDVCPRCGENEVKVINTPERKVKMAPLMNHIQVGDKRYNECMFCHWWSEATWDRHKWVWKTIRPLKPKEREALDIRVRRVKRKRRAFGGKGR